MSKSYTWYGMNSRSMAVLPRTNFSIGWFHYGKTPDNTNPFLASISLGGFFMKGILLLVIRHITKLRWKSPDERS